MIETFPFIGVIESQDDPLKQSRVQVRLYGYHTDNKQILPTNKLRWLNSGVNNSASLSGKGSSGLGYKNGSTVFGYCFDPDMQNGIVICSYHGLMTEQPSPEKGFADPNSELPSYVNESDVNRLARNENVSETIVQQKIDDLYVDIPKGDKTVYNEPETGYGTVYPNNEVFESKSGHIIEIDDTPDFKRIHIFHASGTFFEIRNDGSVTNKSKGDVFDISVGSKNIYSKTEINISADANLNIYSGADTNVYVKGNMVSEVEGNSTITTLGDSTQTVEGSANINVKGNGNIQIEGNATEVIKGSYSKTVSGSCDIKASGAVSIDGSVINLG